MVLTRVKEIRNREGVAQVLGKSGQIAIIDEQGREVERYTLPNGARLHVTDGQSVSNGQLLAEWDPFNEPFVSEVDGFIKFTDLVDGKTYQEKLDEATHQASMTIIEYRTTSFRPSVSVCDENGDRIELTDLKAGTALEFTETPSMLVSIRVIPGEKEAVQNVPESDAAVAETEGTE